MNGETLVKLSDLSNALATTTHLVSVIHTAAESGCIADDADIPEAIFCAWQRLWDIGSQLNELVNEAKNPGTK